MAIPSDEHLKAFGALIYHYANAETGLKICLSGLLDAPLNIVLILAEPYSALNLRTVLGAIGKEYEFEDDKHQERLAQIVGDLKVFGPLRNAIAHSRWTDGARPKSIKPRAVDIRSGKAIYRGNAPDERDWTADEIEECAKKIALVNRRILQFLDDAGLTPRIKKHLD